LPFEISTEETFSAAHLIAGYEGDCSKLHGHNWRVRATVRAMKSSALGLTFDFRKLRTLLKEILGTLDHTMLNDLAPFKNLNPTAETIAEWCHGELARRIDEPGVSVTRVEVWESDRSCAAYTKE
jgi:6-pyruvoyltetrahydropterin/6-carboxytetrahydropterin synthase